MAKTLAELRQSEYVGLPERTYPLCMAGKVAADVEELEAQLDALPERTANGGQGQRVGRKSDQRRIEEEIEKLREVMNDHLVPIRLQAKAGHDWRAFIAEHPPREKDALDQRTGFNVDEVIANLDQFILHVSGEKLKKGEWAWVVENAADGDLKEMTRLLIDMHNTAVDVPKSRLNSQAVQEK